MTAYSDTLREAVRAYSWSVVTKLVPYKIDCKDVNVFRDVIEEACLKGYEYKDREIRSGGLRHGFE